ncbi:Uncharacterised protein [Chlamydia abortus]|nr:Uncharacterised protein [Chlamydia abortus]
MSSNLLSTKKRILTVSGATFLASNELTIV